MSASKQPKPFSVAGFLFMPQFRLSMQGFAHIVPVMMRTIAMLFEQTGLIARNHPATRYGIEGVRKYSFFELMGEAWFTLRTTRAHTYQWAGFGAVVLTIALVVALISTFFLRVIVGVGSVAQAQIFTTAGATDVAAATSPGTVMFDKAAGGGLANPDLAIMLLDKMLRQGAGVGQASAQGGTLQMALGAFFQVYNTGVLVIAGVMLFWLVLSVVVDTAKTGVIGGGRHNMVWAPIRIVFALGLMIPLGATGFSSGQYMVMKLAEWGSNFGTNAWVAYVATVADTTSVIVSAPLQNPSSIVAAYTKMWVCRVAFNSYEFAATGAIDADQRIVTKSSFMANWGAGSYAFTNASATNLCGSVKYKTPGRDPGRMLADNPASSPIGSAYSGVDPMGTMGDAIINATNNYMDNSLRLQAQSIACQFVSEHIADAPVTSGECPATPTFCATSGSNTVIDGDYPDQTCIAQMVQGMRTAVETATTAARTGLNTSISSGDLVDYVRLQGWAGMGIWYHQISSMNRSVLSLADPQVSVVGGELSTANFGTSERGREVSAILEKYDSWWSTYMPGGVTSETNPTTSNGATPALDPTIQAQTDVAGQTAINAPKPSIKSLLSSIDPDKVDEGGVFSAIAGLVGIRTGGTFLVDIVAANNSQTYPLAQLAKVGNTIMMWGLSIVSIVGIAGAISGGACGGAMALPLGLGAIPAAFTCGAKELMLGPVSALFIMIGKTMVTAGILLSYYVPILPFIRVAFAVLTWMISVFEAVLMVPIAALAHLTTEGEGISGGARTAWILWLNILMRPVLTVGGYIGALLIFNSFVVYFNMTFAQAAAMQIADSSFAGILSKLFYTIVYVGVIYTVANTCFKLLDVMPNAMMRWIGGSADQSFDNDSAAEGFISAAGSMLSRTGGGQKLNRSGMKTTESAAQESRTRAGK